MFNRKSPLPVRIFNAHLAHLTSLDCSPIHIRVDGTQLPPEHFLQRFALEDGAVILSIGGDAVRDLEVTEHNVFFSARFSGQPHRLEIPLQIIDSMVGWVEDIPIVLPLPQFIPSPAVVRDTQTTKERTRPKLTVVK